ncbi:hypothetical protein IWW34DRAFT_906212 [Fusarium oxysporum f. sp. albedinis]|uniref:Nucleoside phosphorylase domain-containing protein n=1 Tax=Fusarium redolens TaxID=48865 RepID=A0A9P9G822_FUSRE|nr:uncharacterized protein BKA55DRAFT_695244 [Fusarium redolens]KAH7233732.1 hypothetical protein BKA55DRAFT_695244 [Fusarium redolens]KAI3567767.1 hypothetical protein IWW34DRAFT_906212 [Fusarium oxysporum f. sp. albedinis]KAK2470988.1 hypothetical protein H9L39_17219 [Fusarium oxysporum f. sp. albedinis]
MYPGRPYQPKKRDDFEVAIICALTLEADAVIALFDHHWEDDGFSYGKARGDPNAYSIGVIGQHNVVLAHLPGMGKVSAGNIAAFCRMSFPNIKLALLVGICGGAPYYNKGKGQIRLGDVVISTGIVQYDFGRRFPDKFEIKDSLNDIPGRPNLEIRNLLSKLMTARQSERLKTESWKYLDELCQDAKRPATFPGRSKDLLFPVDYRHKHQDSLACTTCTSCHHESDPVCDIALTSSCEQMGCDTSQCLQRGNRQGEELHPLVHFGAFATGDTVMKSAKDRDYIMKDTQALGFEMESVGVWEVFPCVVIKSVCDYADSHKSKNWQPYAAACAASYAKGFLRYWDSTRHAESISEPEQFRKRIIKSLSYADMNERRNNIPSEAPSTFNWIFEESVEYPGEQDLDWLSDQYSDTNRHSETEWETETASNAEAGEEGSLEAHDDNGTGWETASDEESGQEESLEEDEDNEASWETTSDEKSGKEESPEADDDMETDWGTESDKRSEITEGSTQSHRQWRHWDNFIDWLKSDRSVYWISGKPGSGKSTLMKFLISDSRTPDALKEWNKDAIIIAHFFWKPGSMMQHSFKGLLCSLLRLILKNDKCISHSSLQRLIRDKDGKESPSDWDQRELRDLLLYYRNHSSQPICIFIDALDEISPEQDTLDTLHILGALISPTTKICVSSRPERLFRLHLQDKPSLEIHKLTRPDIEQYSKVSIGDSILLEPQGLKVSDLARRIGEMSQGVFLWAVLVTRSLIRGINNGDSKRDIYRRLNSTPRDLMDLYRDIVTRSATDHDIYQQSASLVFNLVFVVKSIPMLLFEVMMATDGRLLDQYVVQQKSINVQDLVTKGLRMMNTLEAGCAGLLELNGSMQASPADSDLETILYGLEMRLEFIHRSAEEFLLDTEDGRKLWESCPCSREELLIRRTKARLAWFELFTSLNIESRMSDCSINNLIHVLGKWMGEASLPHEVLTSTLNLAQRMYERGSIVPPLPGHCDDLIVSRSPRGQISSYAARSGFIALAKENLATLPDSERHETAYCIFYHSCTQFRPADYDGHMLIDREIVQFMLDNGYNPNWPGILETSTCKFGSPWLQYLLHLHGELSDTAEDILTSTQALTVLNTIHMFLKSGASVHSRLKVVFEWSRPVSRRCFAHIRLGTLCFHRTNGRPDNSDFLILEINARVLLESILVQVHRAIRPVSRLKLPEAASHMKALAFGSYEKKKYFIVDTNWVSELLLEGVKLWFQHATRKHDDMKLNNTVMTICSYVTDKVSEASCRRGPRPF